MVTGAHRGSRINVFLAGNRGESSVHTAPAYGSRAFEMRDFATKGCTAINPQGQQCQVQTFPKNYERSLPLGSKCHVISYNIVKSCSC